MDANSRSNATDAPEPNEWWPSSGPCYGNVEKIQIYDWILENRESIHLIGEGRKMLINKATTFSINDMVVSKDHI